MFTKDLEHTLIGVSLGVVYRLVLFVDSGVLGSTCAGAEASIGIFGDVLVCFLGALVGRALDGLGDVVCGVLRKSAILEHYSDQRSRLLTLAVSIVMM